MFITQGKTNWKFLGIVIILTAIVGAGIFWWNHHSKPMPICGTPLLKNETASSSFATSTTEGWQTYKDEKSGFEMVYLKDNRNDIGNPTVVAG
jgi:hypothetical protein